MESDASTPLAGEPEPPHVKETLGILLRKKRFEKGLNQRDLAKLVKVSYQLIYGWETESVPISGKHSVFMQKFLGITENRFCTLTAEAKEMRMSKSKELMKRLDEGSFPLEPRIISKRLISFETMNLIARSGVGELSEKEYTCLLDIDATLEGMSLEIIQAVCAFCRKKTEQKGENEQAEKGK